MQELIKINETEGQKTVSARELHQKLEVTDRFNRWFESMLKYGFEKDVDFTSVKTSTLVNNGAKRELDEYYISIDMAKEICMIQRSEIGKKFRQYFIECEKALTEVKQATIAVSPVDVERTKLEKAKFLHNIALEYDGKSETYAQILTSYAVKEVVGEFILPLPEVEKRTYSATDIGKMLGISAQKVGTIANRMNIKTSEYGRFYMDKSPYSSKEVETFRYFENAIGIIKENMA